MVVVVVVGILVVDVGINMRIRAAALMLNRTTKQEILTGISKVLVLLVGNQQRAVLGRRWLLGLEVFVFDLGKLDHCVCRVVVGGGEVGV